MEKIEVYFRLPDKPGTYSQNIIVFKTRYGRYALSRSPSVTVDELKESILQARALQAEWDTEPVLEFYTWKCLGIAESGETHVSFFPDARMQSSRKRQEFDDTVNQVIPGSGSRMKAFTPLKSDLLIATIPVDWPVVFVNRIERHC